jgi:amino acid adenylation domain-containing protein
LPRLVWPDLFGKGRKFIGAPIPYGIVLTHAGHAERSSQLVPYLGNRDMTISGSRSGLAALLLWYALQTRAPRFAAEAARCRANALHLEAALERGGRHPLLNPHSTTVVFDRPSADICRRWQLATEGSRAHVVVMQHLNRDRIDAFLADLSAEESAGGTIGDLFTAQTRLTPHLPALVLPEGVLSFAVVDARVTCLAQALERFGVHRGVPVAIRLERSAEAVISVLAVLRAGGAYVPIDPSFPEARQRFILDDSGCGVLISRRSLGRLAGFLGVVLDPDDLDSDRPAPDQPHPAGSAPEPGGAARVPDGTLAILYTSGSTGAPKGVYCSHTATLNRFRWMWEQFPFADGEIACHRTTLSFVDSVWEIFGPLLRGVPLLLLPPEIAADPLGIIRCLQEGCVSRLVLVPSLLRALLEACPNLGERLPRLSLWTVSGETLSSDLLARFRAAVPHATLLNLYGCTEVAGDVTWAAFLPGEPLLAGLVPIGRPLPLAELHIVDEEGNLVRPGEVGELWVGGPVLAAGYHRRPEETVQRFLPNPFSGQGSIFRTGDRVRRDEPGQLHYLGRGDKQVKIRGVRVELGEVEAALAAFPAGIEAIAVVAATNPALPEALELTAYVSPAGLDTDALRAFARGRLPAAMVPAGVIALDDWPLTPNGKTDRAELARRSLRRLASPSGEQEPRTATERSLAAVWEEILRVSPIRRDDDFFALGGDSLSCLAMLAFLRERHGLELPLVEVAHDASLRRLAERLEASGVRANGSAPATALAGGGIQLVPFAPAHLDATVELVSRTFCQRGPLERSLGLRPADLHGFFGSLSRQCLAAGLSTVAVHGSSRQEVVGFCLARDFAAPDARRSGGSRRLPADSGSPRHP